METMLFIVDTENYKGSIVNTMPLVPAKDINKTKVHYKDETFEQYNKNHNNRLVALGWDEYYEKYDKPFKESLQDKFQEISHERWEEMLCVLPPMRWHDLNESLNVFFISEATTGDLHACFIRDRKNNKCYEALRSIFSDDKTLLADFNNK